MCGCVGCWDDSGRWGTTVVVGVDAGEVEKRHCCYLKVKSCKGSPLYPSWDMHVCKTGNSVQCAVCRVVLRVNPPPP